MLISPEFRRDISVISDAQTMFTASRPFRRLHSTVVRLERLALNSATVGCYSNLSDGIVSTLSADETFIVKGSMIFSLPFLKIPSRDIPYVIRDIIKPHSKCPRQILRDQNPLNPHITFDVDGVKLKIGGMFTIGGPKEYVEIETGEHSYQNFINNESNIPIMGLLGKLDERRCDILRNRNK